MKIFNMIPASLLLAILLLPTFHIKSWGTGYTQIKESKYPLTQSWQKQLTKFTLDDTELLQAVEDQDEDRVEAMLRNNKFNLNVLLAANNIALNKGNRALSDKISQAIKASQYKTRS